MFLHYIEHWMLVYFDPACTSVPPWGVTNAPNCWKLQYTSVFRNLFSPRYQFIYVLDPFLERFKCSLGTNSTGAERGKESWTNTLFVLGLLMGFDERIDPRIQNITGIIHLDANILNLFTIYGMWFILTNNDLLITVRAAVCFTCLLHTY